MTILGRRGPGPRTAGTDAGVRPRRALVAGWFSFDRMGATAGDLLARDVACEWLEEVGCPYDVAHSEPFPGGVDWRRVDARAYSHVVFVCGPFWARRKVVRYLPRTAAAGLARTAPFLRRIGIVGLEHFAVELLICRFSGARFVGVDLSMLGPAGSWHPFDPLVARDGAGVGRPDISFASREPLVPVVGLVRVERPTGYERPMQEAVDEAIEDLARSRAMARVPIDTRLDVPNQGGLRTAAEVESLIARMDVVVTTRLHGLVLAIKNGVPPLAIDPIGGGAKVMRQAQTVDWPAALTADALDPQAVRRAFDFCLSDEARVRVRACHERAVAAVEDARVEFLEAFDAPGGG